MEVILNKMTSGKYHHVVKELIECAMTSAENLVGVVSLIYDKAVLEPTFCPVYARLCYVLSQNVPPYPLEEEGGKEITFRRVLLNKCQMVFEGADELRAELSQMTSPDQEDERRDKERLLKLRRLGNIRLIAELWKQNMLTTKVIHHVMRELLGPDDRKVCTEENVEAICVLYKTIGKQLDDDPRSRSINDDYSERLKNLSTNHQLVAHLHFMVRDVLDLRSNNWISRQEELFVNLDSTSTDGTSEGDILASFQSICIAAGEHRQLSLSRRPLEHLSIRQVTPLLNKNWTVDVMVVEKSQPHITKSRTIQRLVLLDKEGSKVQTTLFDGDIDLFKNTLLEFNRYQISNAIVTPVPPKFRYIPNEYQWTINSRTSVIEVQEESSEIRPQMQLVRFADLPAYVDTLTEVDVLAIVIKALPQKIVHAMYGETLIQEFIITNEEMRPMLLTLWSPFAETEGAIVANEVTHWPVILAMRLKVSSFNRLSLATKFTSSLLINPNTAQCASLKSWIVKNEEHLHQLRGTKIYDEQYAEPALVADIIALPKNGTKIKIAALASLRNIQQKLWYMSCNNCRKRVYAEFNTLYNCVHCEKDVVAEPRCSFQIELHDESASITATIYGKFAEKVFPFTAMLLMEKEAQDEHFDVKSLGNLENIGDYIFHIRHTNREISYRNFKVISVSNKE